MATTIQLPDTGLMMHHMRAFLQAAGQDLTSQHLERTPERVAKTFAELLTPPEFEFTVFENTGKYDQIILQNHISFTSLCAHHLLPFSGVAAVAYIPTEKYVGLSKLARAVEYFSHALQTQEELTHEIGNFLQEQLSPLGCAVVMKAEHLCMSIRGVKKPDTLTTTSYMKGAFMERPAARAELMTLIGDM